MKIKVTRNGTASANILVSLAEGIEKHENDGDQVN